MDADGDGKVTKIELIEFASTNNINNKLLQDSLDIHNQYNVCTPTKCMVHGCFACACPRYLLRVVHTTVLQC